jgi:hypothetical protein
MFMQPVSLVAIILAAIAVAAVVATFFYYATGEGPGS